MADQLTGGYSREQVAYILFERIASAEGFGVDGQTPTKPNREWILKTYAECLTTVCSPGIKWEG